MNAHLPSTYLSDNDFARLNYSDRFSLAKELTRAYAGVLFIPFFLLGLFIVIYGILTLRMMNISPAMLTGAQPYEIGADPGKFLFGSLLLFSFFFFLLPFLGVGIKNLILHYIYGQEPESVPAAILAPASRLSFFVICFMLWFVINIAYQFFSLILGAIPIVGFFLTLLFSLFFNMVSNCSCSYMADRGLHKADLTNPVKVISDPLKIVWAHKGVWATTYLTIFLLFVIPGFFLGLGFSFIMIGGVFFVVGIMLFVFSGLGLVLFVIFKFFFMTITYKHTSCRIWGPEAVRPDRG